MPLGYENTGIAPRLLQAAGNSLGESIRRIGQKVSSDINQIRTDREVEGFLGDVKNVDPSSPNFQQELIGVLGKYPMAARDGRALMATKLLMTAQQQQMTQQNAMLRFAPKPNIPFRMPGGGAPGGYGGDGGNLPPIPTGAGMNDVIGAEPEPSMEFGAGNRGGTGGFDAGSPGVSFGAGMANEAPVFTADLGRQRGLGVAFEPPAPQSDTALFDPLQQHGRNMESMGVPRNQALQSYARVSEEQAKQKIRGSRASGVAKIFQDEAGENYRMKPDGSWIDDKAPPAGTRLSTPGVAGMPFQFSDDRVIDRRTGAVTEAGMTEQERETNRLKEEAAGAKQTGADKKSRVDALKDRFNIARDAYNKKLGAIERLRAQGKDVPQADLDALAVQNAKLEGIFEERAALDAEAVADQVFKDEAEARAAGKKGGDEIMIINPRTGKPAKARLN